VQVIDYFPRHLNPLEEFGLTANGLIFRDPIDGIPRLITVNGNIFDLPFIPQRTENLLRIEWAISANGRTIAWAEIYFEQTWKAELYVAQLDGSNFRALPPLPDNASYYRVAMLAVSDDGNRVFFDLEHPTEARRTDDLFLDYQRIMAYVSPNEVYIPLPEEPKCLCPAQIANNGRLFIRLEPARQGYTVRMWNLESNVERRRIEPIDTIFTQAGEILLSPGGTLLLYTVGGIEGVASTETTDYGLILADVATAEQTIVTEPSKNRLHAMAFIDRNTAAIVVDTLNNKTYKLNFETKTLTLVADGLWLGTLQG
jgi:hypothetical protein